MLGLLDILYNCFGHDIYSVVNTDHVELYRILAILGRQVPIRKGGEGEVADILNDFVDLFRAHHSREEGLMARYDYPLIREHGSEHMMLLRTIENLQARVRADGAALTSQDILHIKDRLTGHIDNSDGHLETYLAECRDMRTTRRKDLSQPSRNPLFYVRAIYNGVPASVVMANRAKRASLDAARRRRAQERPMSMPSDGGRKAMDAVWYK